MTLNLGRTIRIPFLPVSWALLEEQPEEVILKTLSKLASICSQLLEIEGPPPIGLFPVSIRISVHYPSGVQNIKEGIGETIFRALTRAALVPDEAEWTFYKWVSPQDYPFVLVTIKEEEGE